MKLDPLEARIRREKGMITRRTGELKRLAGEIERARTYQSEDGLDLLAFYREKVTRLEGERAGTRPGSPWPRGA